MINQQLSNMPDLYGRLLPPENPFQVHQARHIAPHNVVDLVGLVLGQAVFPHFHRKGFLGHAEGAAKATAFVRAGGGRDVDAVDEFQQGFHLRERRFVAFRHGRQTETALSMTTLVNTDPQGPARPVGQGPYLQDIGQKFAQLPDLTGQKRIVFPDVQDTRARWTDNMVKFTKVLPEVLVTASGLASKARIGHGLTAAGLITRHNDLATQLFEQLEGRDGNSRIELINVAGNK